MSMYEVYSNLRSCIEDVEKGGSLDAHIALYALSHHDEVPALNRRTCPRVQYIARDHLALLQARKRLELSIVQRAS